MDYNAVFKDIYYHLYTNSQTSRAEKLLGDITKLLLYIYARQGEGIEYDQISSSSSSEIQSYLSTKYSSVIGGSFDFGMDHDSIKYTLGALAKIELTNAPAHIVGDAVQTIVGPRIRGDKGQFFTPECLADCMVAIAGIADGDIVIDPACGTGGFLTSAEQSNTLPKPKTHFVGVDKDRDMSTLALAVMEVTAHERAEVYCANSLEAFKTGNPLQIYIGKADKVITNPPFGSKIAVTDNKILSDYDFGHIWKKQNPHERWTKTHLVCKKQDPQILFLELCVRLLKEGGILAIVLPEGVFYSKNLGYVWQYLMDNGEIIALLDCPRNTFQPSTDTKTNVLFFKKTSSPSSSTVWMSSAEHCGHDRRGRTVDSAGNLIPDDFTQISNEWRNNVNSSRTLKYWVQTVLKEDLYIPRYYVNLAKWRSKHDDHISLGELIAEGKLSIRSGHEVGSAAYGTGPVPYVRTSDINNFEISSDPTNSVSLEIYNKYSSAENLQAGDILFIADGRYRIGKTALINKFNKKCLVQSHINILTLTDDAPISPIELLYLLNTADVRKQVTNLVFISSTLGTIGQRIKEVQIPIPARDNEWNLKIKSFESNLEQRARLLEELSDYEYSEDSD